MYLGTFGWNLKKTITIFLVSTLRNFTQNLKILTFRLKKCFIWVFSGYNSKKPLSYLKSTPSNLSDCKGWCKIKFLKFGTKNVRFLYFCIGIWKYYCHVSNQRPRICLVAKFCSKIKILKFGTKNDWFWYFWAGTWKNCCHVWYQQTQICLIANFAKKQQCLNLKPKMCDSSIFGLEF